MRSCKICNQPVNGVPKGASKDFCSHKCYEVMWRENNREKYRERMKRCWVNTIKKKTACIICGFTRALDLCHVKARKDGGMVNKKNIIVMCPNHHRLYDQGLLAPEELSLVEQYLVSLTK